MQISNKSSRIEELLAFVGELELGAEFTESKLQSLRGRLLYAAGNTFGRCTQVAVQALGRVARKGTSMVLEDDVSMHSVCGAYIGGITTPSSESLEG